MSRFWSALVGALLFSASCASQGQALPTPTNSTVIWEASPDARVVGYFVYWCEGTPGGCSYEDARRTNVGDATNYPVVGTGSLCFRVTAVAAPLLESQFSDEACGWFGTPAPAKVKVN